MLTFFRNVLGQDWSYDIYYVNEADSRNVLIQDDDTLKYQVEFKTNTELPANSVEIRIPQALLEQRDGKQVLPDEIAVPRGTPEEPVESRIVSFNYYIEDSDLVFFNYEALKAGSSTAFQVLYRNLDIMQLTDGSQWSLASSCTVATTGEEETKQAEPLTGQVNSKAVLSSVRMTPYVIDGKNYAPGLYTQTQIENIISGTLPEKYQENFSAYHYVVWEVTVYGSATQPWELYVKDTPGSQGEVVGFSTAAQPGESPYEGYYKITSGSSQKIQNTFKIVTAYSAEKVPAGATVKNQIEVVLHPYDGVDEDTQKQTEASWTYTDYQWQYEGDGIQVRKTNQGNSSYSGWLNIYKSAKEKGEDKGDRKSVV